MKVFVLEHTHVVYDDVEDIKMMGVYSSRKNALMAKKRYRELPGFRDSPRGFSISAFEVDQDAEWREGFVTVKRREA